MAQIHSCAAVAVSFVADMARVDNLAPVFAAAAAEVDNADVVHDSFGSESRHHATRSCAPCSRHTSSRLGETL